MNGNGDALKEKIVKTLQEQPIGLTIRDLSRTIGAHRQTIAKYVLVLEAEGLIHRRVVGSAALHYPKGVSLEPTKKKGAPQKAKKRSVGDKRSGKR